MSETFVRRRLKYTIEIGRGENGDDGFDKYELPIGLRSTAAIEQVGGLTMGSAQVSIFGLTLDLMNKVSTLGLSPIRLRYNRITIAAGDDVNGLAQIFQGDIREAWQEFDGAPDTSLHIAAYANQVNNLKPVPPSSYQGSVSIETIMSDLARKMGLGFENSGVQGVISNPYFTGTARQQALACAEAGHFEMDDTTGSKLTIWSKGTSRGSQVVILSKSTGLVGYPKIGAQNNIQVRCLFNKGLAQGSKVKVESVIKAANNIWSIYKLSHDLSSETVGGPWFSSFEATPPGATPPVV